LVFGANAVVAAGLTLLLATAALVLRPPAPPGISEFAPQAAKPITKAPATQPGVSGGPPGDCREGEPCSPGARPTAPATRPTAAPRVIGVASVHQCVSWPDGSVTQTFDRQSPPCVAAWTDRARGNGGATTRGVTATEIRLAVPKNTDSTDTEFPELGRLVDFVNEQYELYGRKIRVVPFDAPNPDASKFGDPQAQHASAVTAAGLMVFAAVDFFAINPNSPTLPEYGDTLAPKGVVSVSGGIGAPFASEASLSSHAPYQWSYFPAVTELLESSAQVLCRQLVGHPAALAGDAELQHKTRRFAVLTPDDASTGGIPGVRELATTLGRCAHQTVRVVEYDPNTNDGSSISVSLQQMQREGVTTIVKLPWLDDCVPSGPHGSADRLFYNPEWFWIGYASWMSGVGALSPTRQLDHTFGVGNWNKLFAPAQMPWHRAYVTAGGPSADRFQSAETFYHELLVLAAGIQMAGPRLTPESFAEALHSTVFPNPGAGGAPDYQGTVGFPGQSMVRDAQQFWFTPGTTSAQFAAGIDDFNNWNLWCYVGLGARATAQGWGTSDRYYKGRCR
jgi:hypothetical protein